jgi:hypothetical protein
MSEHVSLSADGSHVAVRSSGPPSLAELDATLAHIAELRERHGIDRVLVDSRERTGQPRVPELIAGGRMLAERLGPAARVAVLVRALEDGHAYFRISAAGLGAAVAYFVDRALAESWLHGSE